MATPTEAFFRPPTSLVPSPHIRTSLPVFFSSSMIISFCAGLVLAKTVILLVILMLKLMLLGTLAPGLVLGMVMEVLLEVLVVATTMKKRNLKVSFAVAILLMFWELIYLPSIV